MAKARKPPQVQAEPLATRMLRHPLLSRDEERALLRKAAAGDVAARDRLVTSNARFIATMAHRYGPRSGIETEDAFQEGVIGEMKAVGKFDVATGNRLSTYATWWVRQAIQRAGQETARTIRLPAPMLALVRSLGRTRDAIEASGAEATDAALMEAMGLDAEQFKVVSEAARLMTVSLDAPVSDDGNATLADYCGDPSTGPEPVHDHVERQERRLALEQAVRRLSEVERAVLRSRFEGGLTLEETADEIAPLTHDGRVLSHERVRQIQADAIRKLRRAMIVEDPP